MHSQTRDDAKTAATVAVVATLALALLLALIMGGTWGFKAFNRSQRVADAKNVVTTSRIKANNQVELNRIQIGTQRQRVQIAQQKAEIRLKEAQGIRKAQDEIAKTITPLYVQLEQTRVLGEIAKSGKNSTVVYIPVGKDGLPVVADAGKAGGAR